MPTKSKRPAVKKPTEHAIHAVLDATEHARLNAEVTRRKVAAPSTRVTRESVVRSLIRDHLCAPGAGTVPSTTAALTKPVKDKFGRKMTVRVGAVEQVFRWVPPGSFTQGSPKGEAGRWDDEGPQHEVKLSGYWVADTPVTQALFEAVMGSNPSRFKGPERPVETVSWDDAKSFIVKLNALAPGLDARLPTEAEWENACRAGTTTATWVGDLDLDPNGGRAGVLDPIAFYWGNGPDGTRSVKGKQPNPLGLYDMLGNVYEWCGDFFGPYAAGRLTDPTGPTEGSLRVIRGGSWYGDARYVRAANRGGLAPQNRLDDLGFRLARGHQA